MPDPTDAELIDELRGIARDLLVCISTDSDDAEKIRRAADRLEALTGERDEMEVRHQGVVQSAAEQLAAMTAERDSLQRRLVAAEAIARAVIEWQDAVAGYNAMFTPILNVRPDPTLVNIAWATCEKAVATHRAALEKENNRG